MAVVFLLLPVLPNFASSEVYKAGKLGGYGGGDYFDHFAELGRPTHINVRQLTVWTSSNGLLAFEASYAVDGNYTHPIATSRQTSIVGGSVASPSYSVILEDGDFISEMFGYHKRSGNVFLVNRLGFVIHRADGTIDRYERGPKSGWYVSILGPIVCFYGDENLVFDQLGGYIDPALWEGRPSRLMQGPREGVIGSDASEPFDNFLYFGNPFTLKIKNITLFYSSRRLCGISSWYIQSDGQEVLQTHGILDQSVNQKVATLEPSDFISEVIYSAASTDDCVRLIDVLIYRAGSQRTESLLNAQSSSAVGLAVVSFYGFSDTDCIVALGSYLLLPSTHFKDACEIPSPPGNGSINNASDVAAGDVISVTCSGGFVLFGDSNLTCLDDGFWSGGVGSCERVCATPALPEGAYISDETLFEFLVGAVLQIECELGYSLVASSNMTCLEDGTWSGIDSIACEMILCPSLGSPEYGSITIEPLVNTVGSNYTFKCDRNCDLSGPDIQFCLRNGSWNGTQPQCNCTYMIMDPTSTLLDPIHLVITLVPTLVAIAVIGVVCFVLFFGILLSVKRKRRSKSSDKLEYKMDIQGGTTPVDQDHYDPMDLIQTDVQKNL